MFSVGTGIFSVKLPSVVVVAVVDCSVAVVDFVVADIVGSFVMVVIIVSGVVAVVVNVAVVVVTSSEHSSPVQPI